MKFKKLYPFSINRYIDEEKFPSVFKIIEIMLLNEDVNSDLQIYLNYVHNEMSFFNFNPTDIEFELLR